MRLNISPLSTSVGSVQIHDLFRVSELDAGHFVNTSRLNTESGASHPNSITGNHNIAFSHDSIQTIETELAIIVPCMNEEQDILDGVLHGVPHDCLIILVSNSSLINFGSECDMLAKFCETTQRKGIAAHQQNEGLALAFLAGGMEDLLIKDNIIELKESPQRCIRNGKGEAMLIGTAIAKLAAKQYIGFIDADNFVTGSVHEYCKAYAAGLYYALHDTAQSGANRQAMVRIKWNSKPKVRNNKLVFEKSGRSSRIVNEWMNRFLNSLVGRGPDPANDTIQTGNAGEHAMTTDLAMTLRFATGYAVEPFQLIDVLEQFGWRQFNHECSVPSVSSMQCFATAATLSFEKYGSKISRMSQGSTPVSSDPPSPTSSEDSTAAFSTKVRIIQVETRNPHFHDSSKGNEHVQRMAVQGLSTIYHSRLVSQTLKNELQVYIKKKLPKVAGENGVPDAPRVYPSLQTLNFVAFKSVIKDYPDSIKVFGTKSWKLR